MSSIVTHFAEGLIPTAQPGGMEAHFGTHAVQGAVLTVSDWFQNGMSLQELLTVLSSIKVLNKADTCLA